MVDLVATDSFAEIPRGQVSPVPRVALVITQVRLAVEEDLPAPAGDVDGCRAQGGLCLGRRLRWLAAALDPVDVAFLPAGRETRPPRSTRGSACARPGPRARAWSASLSVRSADLAQHGGHLAQRPGQGDRRPRWGSRTRNSRPHGPEIAGFLHLMPKNLSTRSIRRSVASTPFGLSQKLERGPSLVRGLKSLRRSKRIPGPESRMPS